MTITVKEYSNKGGSKHFDNGDEFYYSPVVDGKEYSHIAETEDMAMIVGIAIKYDGLNSQFPKFAARMLCIDSEWTK